jgi:hypothetical protein
MNYAPRIYWLYGNYRESPNIWQSIQFPEETADLTDEDGSGRSAQIRFDPLNPRFLLLNRKMLDNWPGVFPARLFIPQRIDRIEAGRFARGVIAKKDSDQHREEYRADDRYE